MKVSAVKDQGRPTIRRDTRQGPAGGRGPHSCIQTAGNGAPSNWAECGERPKGDRRFNATQGKAQPAAGVPGAAFKQPGTSLHQSG